jgi:hypothetical protein
MEVRGAIEAHETWLFLHASVVSFVFREPRSYRAPSFRSGCENA